MSHRLRLKGQVKNAGIYHVGTGTWTRAGALKEQLGPNFFTLYNNTCSSPFFGSIYPNETWTDEGRLPGVNSPDRLYNQDQASVAAFVGAVNECPEGPSSAPGSAKGTAALNGSYTVDAFTLGYCSDLPGPLSVPAGTGANLTVDFRPSTPLDVVRCADGPLVAPAPNASFSLVSFPGAGAGPFGCWLVALDLTGVTASFTMRADGTGDYNGGNKKTTSELERCFSWSFSFPGIASPTTTAASGMILAGVPADAAHLGWLTATTTGGGLTAACSGYDGTVWDHQEVNAAPVWFNQDTRLVTNANVASGTLLLTGLGGEPGTGMSTQDSVRVDLNPATSVNGCYFFGGPGGTNPFSSFHLKLHTLATVTLPQPASDNHSGFCYGDGCAFTCPCVAPNVVPDPQGSHNSGCANTFFLNVAGGNSGAVLKATGKTRTRFGGGGLDSLTFTCTNGAFGFGFLVKGNAGTVNGVFPATSDGVRCASGALVRFGGHNFGSNGALAQQWTYPNTAQTTQVSVATAQAAGARAWYQLFYRNPLAGHCNPQTTNFSNGLVVQW
ncbi:MAG: hypothetical protein ACKVWV_19790 [Planctomycetota bacterium]